MYSVCTVYSCTYLSSLCALHTILVYSTLSCWIGSTLWWNTLLCLVEGSTVTGSIKLANDIWALHSASQQKEMMMVSRNIDSTQGLYSKGQELWFGRVPSHTIIWRQLRMVHLRRWEKLLADLFSHFLLTGWFFSLVPPLKVLSTKKLTWARLGVSRPIYVNVDSPNLGFTYFNFLGGYQWKKSPCIMIECEGKQVMI